jgi:hypothetical protein
MVWKEHQIKRDALRLAKKNSDFRTHLIRKLSWSRKDSKIAAFHQDYEDVILMAKNDGRFYSDNSSRRKPRSAVEAAQKELGLRLPHKDFRRAVKEVADIWKEEDQDPFLNER